MASCSDGNADFKASIHRCFPAGTLKGFGAASSLLSSLAFFCSR